MARGSRKEGQEGAVLQPRGADAELSREKKRRSRRGETRREEGWAGFYADLCTPEELDDLTAALENPGLDDEIALLKVLIKRAVAAGAGAHTVTPAVNALVRALKVRHTLKGDAARNLDEALARALTEIGHELGIGV